MVKSNLTVHYDHFSTSPPLVLFSNPCFQHPDGNPSAILQRPVANSLNSWYPISGQHLTRLNVASLNLFSGRPHSRDISFYLPGGSFAYSLCSCKWWCPRAHHLYLYSWLTWAPVSWCSLSLPTEMLTNFSGSKCNSQSLLPKGSPTESLAPPEP